jgi:cellobiose phosphorylase
MGCQGARLLRAGRLYAPRTFLDGVITDRGGYMDNTVWITFNIYHLLKEIGDLTILQEVVSFNDGTEGTVYEHLKRSVDFLWNARGELGLVKIGGGDWNDCLNQVGLKGRGMSVWLSIAWYLANRQFAEIADLNGLGDDAKTARERGEEMKKVVNDIAWDGEHYLVAYTDNLDKLGSMENDEGKMHIMPQIWSVMAGIGMDGKDIRAMDAVERHMMTDLGVRMAWPPYSYSRPDIGDTTRKLPGVHENGGVYIHAYTWKTAADAMLKRNAKVQENLEKMLPGNHKWVEKHCEPYIMCNSYFPEETGYRYARAGQTWRTGSGAWFLKDVAYYIFGLQPEMEGLRLNPCLPPDWSECSVEKVFRGARYHISYQNSATGDRAEIRSIEVNGKPHGSDILPWETGGNFEVLVRIK